MAGTNRRTRESAPAPAPAALARVAASEKVTKGARVYLDIPDVPRVLLADGRMAAIQRERYADGTDGGMLLAIIRAGTDGRESALRYPLGDIQKVADAMGAAGLVLVEPFTA